MHKESTVLATYMILRRIIYRFVYLTIVYSEKSTVLESGDKYLAISFNLAANKQSNYGLLNSINLIFLFLENEEVKLYNTKIISNSRVL